MKNFSLKAVLVSLSLILSSKNIYAQQANQQVNSDRFSPVPVVTIGGFLNANAGFRSEDGAFSKDRLPDAAVNPSTGAIIEDSSGNQTGTQNRMTNNPDFTNEAEIHIKVAGINEFGMKYGAIVELQGNTSNSARNEGVNADKAYIFTESRMGKLEFGNNSAVNHKMKVGPETFARGAGGINGKYLEYINMPMLANSSSLPAGSTAVCTGGVGVNASGAAGGTCGNIKLPRFILVPRAPIAHGGYAKGFYNRETDNDYNIGSGDNDLGFNKNKTNSQIRDGQFGDLEDASKVSYYTPRISGWQLGASFTPDTGTSGTSATISGDNSGDIKQAISYAVNYSDNFGNLGFALSATGETGKFEQNSSTVIQRNNLQAYDLGFMASYFGATFGASYGNWGKSLQPKTGAYSCDYDPTLLLTNQTCAAGSAATKFSDATYYTAGAAYQFGPFAASVTYLDSNFQENKYNAISFGVDYRMAKGLMPYVEVTQYKFVSNQPKASNISIDQANLSNKERQLKDNSGYVVLAGLLFSF
ncbi:MAG: porin [Pseudomonadota bacterium]